MPDSTLRFPIGKFNPPNSITTDHIDSYVHTINELPYILGCALEKATNEQLDTPYRKYGWTVRQVVHHLADSHMNSFIRFKLALTEDNPTIKPYIESLWADMSDAKNQSIKPSMRILEGVHSRWSHLLLRLHPNDYTRIFTHPEHGSTFRLDTTLALYAWHSRHHFAHINSVIKSEFTL